MNSTTTTCLVGICVLSLPFPQTAIAESIGPGTGFDLAVKSKAYASSHLPDHEPKNTLDENAKTVWKTADEDAMLWVDLGARMKLAGISHDLRSAEEKRARAEIVTWDNSWAPQRTIIGTGRAHIIALPMNAQYVGLRLATPGMLGHFGVFQAGWRPQRNSKDLRLQDFCIFRHKKDIYIASMMKDHCNQGIVVARSRDLVKWKELGIAVSQRTPEDSAMVWAPHVVEHKGRFHMFYTGVVTPAAKQWNQRIMVASTSNPDAVRKWQRNQKARFIVDGRTQSWFRPSHPGHHWPTSAWADCRDPMVLYQEKYKAWYMFYTGSDVNGGIVGVATAPDVLGPWEDRGAILRLNKGIPESSFVLQDPSGSFVMVFNHAGGGDKGGIKVARSKSLLPVDGQPSFSRVEILSKSTTPGLSGWAHEFIHDADNAILAAYLTGYWINFQDVRFVQENNTWTVGGIVESKRPERP